MSRPNLFPKVIDIIREETGIEVRMFDKSASWWNTVLGWGLSKISPDSYRWYMENAYTAIGGRVYRPVNASLDREWEVLCHEGVHIIYHSRYKWLNPIGYLFPAVLAPVFVTLAAVFSWWWLVGLVCLAPLPAYWRMRQELEAYFVSQLVYHWIYGISPSTLTGLMVKYFTTGMYYWMWPFEQDIRNRFARKWSEYLNTGNTNNRYIVKIYRLLNDQGVLLTRHPELDRKISEEKGQKST